MADAPKLLGTDTLRQAYPKFNQAIDNANTALTKAITSETNSTNAVSTANQAKAKSEETQQQLDTIVIESGTSDAETLQARGGFPLLKDRLDSTDAQLADVVYPLKRFNVQTTQDIQNVINNNIGKTIYVDAEYMIDCSTPLLLPSGTRLKFAPFGKFKAIPSSLDFGTVIRIDNKQDIVIENPVLEGDKSSHTGNYLSGTYVDGSTLIFGIFIKTGKNIRISNPIIKGFIGDGIYIGRRDGDIYKTEYSEDVLIENPVIDDCDRQGISIATGKNIRVINPTITNIKGKNRPHAAIDLETNYPEERLDNIVIDNLQSSGNSYGVLVSLQLIGNSPNHFNVKIKGLTDKGSERGFVVTGATQTVNNTNPIKGKIIVDSPYLVDNTIAGINIINYNYNHPRIIINNPTVINANTSMGTSATINNGVAIVTDSGWGSIAPIGNVEINNIDVRDSPNAKYGLYIRDIVLADIRDVIINGIQNINGAIPFRNESPCKVIDRTEKSVFNFSAGSATASTVNYYSIYTNKGATSAKNLTLNSDYFIGAEITVKVETAQKVTVIPPADTEFIPGSLGVGKGMYTSTPGASLLLRKVSSTQWVIISQIGDWTRTP